MGQVQAASQMNNEQGTIYYLLFTNNYSLINAQR